MMTLKDIIKKAQDRCSSTFGSAEVWGMKIFLKEEIEQAIKDALEAVKPSIGGHNCGDYRWCACYVEALNELDQNIKAFLNQ